MSQYRRDIDGLRAIAVVPVVLYHAGIPLLSDGFVGVDIFFVISGFLITKIIVQEIGQGRFSILGFYERRARRILPALMVVLTTSFIVGWVLLLPPAFSDFSKSAMATALFSSNFWFWRMAGGYFGDASEFLPLLHTWSLAVEEQFYILFPLFLMMVAAKPRLAISLLWIGITASFILAIIAVARWPGAAFYLAPTRAWELGLGAALAITAAPTIGNATFRNALGLSGLAVIAFAVLSYDEATAFPGAAALLPCLGSVALIIAGGSGPNLASTILSSPPLVGCGLISYSLYLWHWPILAYLRVRLQTIDLPPLWALAAVVVAVFCAFVSWRFIERPFRKSAAVSRAGIFVLAGASTVCVLLAASWVIENNGVRERLPASAMLMADAAHDINARREECFAADDARPRSCQMGAGSSGAADFLLWGDSHADALFAGVDHAARVAGRGGVFVGRSSCPPLFDVDRREQEGAGPTSCRAFNDQVRTILRERPGEFQIVFLAARWASWEAGIGYGAEDPGTDPFITDDQHRETSRATNGLVFRDGVRRTVAEITASGRRVVLLGPVPEVGWNVPTHYYLHRRWGDPLPLENSIEQIERRQAGVNETFAEISASDDVIWVRVSPLLCETRCRTSYQERLLYVDDDHLSSFAATEIVAPAIVRALWGQDDPDENNSPSFR